MRKFGTLLVAVGALMLMSCTAFAGGGSEKITICHAAGLEGTTHYETLNIGYEAVYGEAGHFYENGTTRAGHEQDYLGECRGDETTTTLDEETTTTVAETTTTVAETTTTEAEETTTTEAEETTTTVAETTTSGPAELPYTGANTGIALIAFGLLAAGVTAVRAAKMN